jgi:hypothetical protein
MKLLAENRRTAPVEFLHDPREQDGTVMFVRLITAGPPDER